MKKSIAFLLTFVLLLCSVFTAFATDRVLGDVDNSGKIDIIDATTVQRSLAKLIELDTEAFLAADVDGDGIITVMDATLIQRYVAKIIDKFPIDVEPTEPSSGVGSEENTDPTEAETQTPSGPTEAVEPNEYELEVFRLVNVEREKEGLPPLEFGYFIYDCAKLRAKECSSIETLSHIRPNGAEFYTVFDELGVTQQHLLCGENIALGHVSAEEVVNGAYGWMNSESHRKNILHQHFKYVAIGSYEPPQYPGTYSTVQIFWG